MKFIPLTLTIAFVIILVSCRKEADNSVSASISSDARHDKVKRAYKDRFTTSFQFVPDIANGWDPQHPTPYLAWYPGGGTGNATHMGNAQTYFNQYVPFNPPFFSSVHAPVNMFFSSELAAAGLASVSSEVSSVVYDSKGNSIWFHQLTNATVPVSESRIEFSGTSEIVGGTGKFWGADGEVTLKGYFNPTNPQDAAVSAEGWIIY